MYLRPPSRFHGNSLGAPRVGGVGLQVGGVGLQVGGGGLLQVGGVGLQVGGVGRRRSPSDDGAGLPLFNLFKVDKKLKSSITVCAPIDREHELF